MVTTAIDRTLAEAPGSYLITRDGAQLRLRSATSADCEVLARFFAGLTADDVRYRFLDARKPPTAQDIAAMADVDHRRTEHVLAFDTATGELVGSLLIAADPDWQAAEVAIAVASTWKGRGIGWTLLRHALETASLRGIKMLRCIEDRTHWEAVAVERALGFHERPIAGEPTLVLLQADLA